MKQKSILSRRRKSQQVSKRKRARNLHFESLERRNLLASVELLPAWRTDQFTGNGTFAYLYSQSNPSYTDAIPTGNVQINTGSIKFTSPIAGTWDVGARVTGNGSETAIGRACSTYSAIHDGVMSGSYLDGTLKGTRSTPTSSSFPVYNSAFFVCTNPTTPTDYSPFQSSLARLITGSYDEKTDKAGFNWNGPYADGTIAITIPPSVISYVNTAPADLVVTASSEKAGLEIFAVVNGKHMIPSAQGRSKPVTDVKLFYTSQPKKDSILSAISLNKPIEVFWNTKEIKATVTDFDDVPANARYIMVQIDGSDSIAENASNNETFVPILDIALTSFQGADPAVNRLPNQVALTYTISRATNNPEDDEPFEVSILGADNVQNFKKGVPISSFEISPDAINSSGGTFRLLGEPAENALRNGNHTLLIDSKAFQWSSLFADPTHSKIIAIADMDNQVFEGDRDPVLEDNHATFSGFVQDDASSVAVLRTGSDDDDRVDISMAGGLQVDWVGRVKISVPTAERLVVFTSGGNDTVLADESNGKVDVSLELHGQAGNDVLVGASASDRLHGGDGDDVLVGMGESDFLMGDAGEEVILGDGFILQGFQLKDLTDALKGYLTSQLLSFSFQLTPADGDGDVIEAGPGGCLIFGGTGGDIITGGSGTSIIFGGSLQTKTAQANFDLKNGGSNFQNAIRVLSSLLEDVEIVDSGENNITGGTGPNLIVGGPSPDTILGGDGPIDILIGNDSIDDIYGEGGFNLIVGGNEADNLYGGNGGNVIFGDSVELSGLNFHFESLFNASTNLFSFLSPPKFELSGNGDDHIFGGAGFDFLVGGDGKDTIHGGDGLNVAFGDDVEFQVGGLIGQAVSFASLANKLSQVSIGNFTAVVGLVGEVYGLFESIWSSLSGDSVELADDYFGGNGTDFVFGGGGNDQLLGGLSIDFMVGGFGNDTFRVDPASELIQDGWIDDFAVGGFGDDVFYGSTNDDYLASTFGNDWFDGNDGDDIISSGDGADTLIGGRGNDVLISGAGTDVLLGGAGNDIAIEATALDVEIDREPIEVNTLLDELDTSNQFVSLREAILQANAQGGYDAIVFDEELSRNVSPGSRSLMYLNGTALPHVTDPLLILGPQGYVIGISANGLSEAITSEPGIAFSMRGLPIFDRDLGLDFGDAPLASQSGLSQDYPTLMEHNGASHPIGPWLIGATLDAEADGQPDSTASGDEQFGDDDEDGIRLLSDLIPNGLTSSVVSFVVDVSLPGYLQGWIDLNHDGLFDKQTEAIVDAALPGLPVKSGPNLVRYQIPAGTVTGTTFVRFRLNEYGSMDPDGGSSYGEVVDQRIDFAPQPNALVIDLPNAELGSNRLNYVSGRMELSLETDQLWFANVVGLSTELTINGTSESDLLSIQSDAIWTNETISLGAGNDIVELSNLSLGNLSFGEGTDRLRWKGNQPVFDLVSLVGSVTQLEELEFFADIGRLIIDPVAIIALSNGRNSLDVLVRSRSTSLQLESGWKWTLGVVENGVYKHQLQRDGVSLRLRNGNPWQNPILSLDVDRDDQLSPLDVLVLVNSLNTDGVRGLLDPAQTSIVPASYFDVDGDNSVSPLDVLIVINAINAQQRNGEGEHANESRRILSSEMELIAAPFNAIQDVSAGLQAYFQCFAQREFQQMVVDSTEVESLHREARSWISTGSSISQANNVLSASQRGTGRSPIPPAELRTTDRLRIEWLDLAMLKIEEILSEV